LSAQFILVLIAIRPRPIRMPYRTRPARICGIPAGMLIVLRGPVAYDIVKRVRIVLRRCVMCG